MLSGLIYTCYLFTFSTDNSWRQFISLTYTYYFFILVVFNNFLVFPEISDSFYHFALIFKVIKILWTAAEILKIIDFQYCCHSSSSTFKYSKFQTPCPKGITLHHLAELGKDSLKHCRDKVIIHILNGGQHSSEILWKIQKFTFGNLHYHGDKLNSCGDTAKYWFSIWLLSNVLHFKNICNFKF